MIKFTTLSKMLKRDVDYIDSVNFSSYKGNTCICTISFKSLQDSVECNKYLIDVMNYYLTGDFNVFFSKYSTSKNICLTFLVKLS